MGLKLFFQQSRFVIETLEKAKTCEDRFESLSQKQAALMQLVFALKLYFSACLGGSERVFLQTAAATLRKIKDNQSSHFVDQELINLADSPSSWLSLLCHVEKTLWLDPGTTECTGAMTSLIATDATQPPVSATHWMDSEIEDLLDWNLALLTMVKRHQASDIEY